MKERERIIVSALVALMVILWLGFTLHQSPRFAGSFWGGVLAVTGSVLMLVPLLYLVVKRIKPLKKRVTKHISMRTLLAVHIYAGVVGPILALLHTGHKFESPLGIALTAMMLIVVISGFVGRYLMTSISKEIKEKRTMLDSMNSAYEQMIRELRSGSEKTLQQRPAAGLIGRFVTGFFIETDMVKANQLPVAVRAVAISESIADLEYAIRTHETFKQAFATWLKIHILLSIVLYILLGLHVWSAIYFGLRWFA